MKTEIPKAGTLVGYARVSTTEQNLGLQIEALAAAGVDRGLIFTDKVSGVSSRRPGRDAAIRQMRRGDTLVVWKLDRVSRSLLDLLTLIQRLEDEGIMFRSLTDPIDTTGPMGRAIVAILGAVAQLERDLIQQRIKAGVRNAIANGVRFGKPTIFTKDVQAKVWKWLHDDNLSAIEVAARLKCHPNSFRRVYTQKIIESIRAGRHPRIVTTTKR